jgi:glutathione S-transferase
MKLHHSPTSPYVRKVLIVLHETGLIDRVTLTTNPSTPLAESPALTAANPLGRVPCLEREDGPAIFDSRVICRYLDSLHGGRRLYPEGGALWTTLTLEALADGMLDSAIACIYEARLRPEELRFQPWVDAQKGKIRRALDVLEAEWTAHLAGPLDAGAIAVGATLGYIDFRFADLAWREGRPRLAHWHEGFAARDSYKATAPAA